jgi:hypothetical protein
MIVAAPGRLWGSLDDLATFQPIATEGLGPGEVLALQDGKVWARGLGPTNVTNTRTGLASMWNTHGVLKRAPDGRPALEVATRTYPSPPIRDGDEDLGYADGVQRGEAVWSGKRYLELKPSDDVKVPHGVRIGEGSVEHLAKIGSRTTGAGRARADGNLVERSACAWSAAAASRSCRAAATSAGRSSPTAAPTGARKRASPVGIGAGLGDRGFGAPAAIRRAAKTV